MTRATPRPDEYLNDGLGQLSTAAGVQAQKQSWQIIDSSQAVTNAGSTTVASGSNGVNVSTFTGSGTLNVASTTGGTGFPSAGSLYVATSAGNVVVTYTGTTSTSFTGCTCQAAGTLSTGGSVLGYGTQPGPTVMQVGQIANTFQNLGNTNSNAARWVSSKQPIYGMQLHDESSGNPVAHYGSQPDGTIGLWFLADSTASNPVLRLNKNGLYVEDGSANDIIKIVGGGTSSPVIEVVDSGGTVHSRIGVLPDGSYGIAQLATQGISSGDTVDLGLLTSPVYNSSSATVNTTSTSFQTSDLVDATATLGLSGNALVTVNAFIYVEGTNASGYVGLYIDGSLVDNSIVAVFNNTGGSVGLSGSGTYLANLTSGSHTFGVRTKTSLGSVTVQTQFLSVLVAPY